MPIGALILGALAAPGIASAAFETNSFDVDGSHGYTVRVTGNNQNFVGLTTWKGKGFATTSYDTSGTSTKTKLQADLGTFGTIDLTFHPKKTIHPPNPPRCNGSLTRTEGVYKGTLKFTGENGYTKVNVHSADGKHVVDKLNCHGHSHHRTHVHLLAQTGGSMFQADLIKQKKSKPYFSAFRQESAFPVTIYRTAGVTGPRSDFTYNDPSYTKAKVRPPAPFSGKGVYDNGTWTGSLQIDFPGAPNTPYAGPGWGASLGEVVQKRGPLGVAPLFRR